MKCKIKYQTQRYCRIEIIQKTMTCEQADILEYWASLQKGVKSAVVHERTHCLIVEFNQNEALPAFLKLLSTFRYDSVSTGERNAIHSGREINRYYEDKLIMRIVMRMLRSLFLPPWIRSVLTTVRSVPYLWAALKCLYERQLRVELLDGLSIGISLIRKDFATAGSVRFLLGIGALLDEWTHKKSVNDLARSMSLNIERVWKLTANGEECVGIDTIQKGDKLAIRMGNVIPLDGLIVTGEVMINQASLTGESVPVEKRPGTRVYAGTVVEEGTCVIEVTQDDGGSRYDKIVSMIEQSEKLKSGVENNASHLADKLVPYTLVGSVITYLLTRNVTRALSILMVDFSCALKLAMPLAVLSAMREASTYHITVKGGKYLEAVAKADTVVFDKTGTLTHACPTVADLIPFGNHDSDEMLRIAACLEEHFPHSMANAVVHAAFNKNLLHEEMHSKVEYLVAHGIASLIDDQRVIIGSAHFVFEDEKCRIPEDEIDKFNQLPNKYSHLYMAIGQSLAAVICIYDPLRTESASVLSELKKLGIRTTAMLTGDSDRTASSIAKEVGVDHYLSEVLPETKAEYVKKLHDEGHTVIMLGDGINDAPALSAADVGIAVSDGAAIAREIADITISADSLTELLILRRLSVALMNRIRRNYDFVIGFNGTLIVLGMLGILPPATSSLLHNLSTLGISLQSMTDLLPSNTDASQN